MIFSTSSSNKVPILLVIGLFLIAGCVTNREKKGHPLMPASSNPQSIHEPLKLATLTSDKKAPQSAGMTQIRWTVAATGGVGKHTYEFYSYDDKKEKLEQKGPYPVWNWTPKKAGTYRVKVVVLDTLDNRAESGWSADYEITPPFVHDSLIAVLPIENLSRTKAPLKEIRRSLIQSLKRKGINILEDKRLWEFMEKYRIRYTGGINRAAAKAFREETGTEAVLITSVELYSDTNPPKFALISRLVLTGDQPIILWMDGVGLAGDDSPGILDLGLILDPQLLVEKALEHLTGSLRRYMPGKREKQKDIHGKKKFQPKVSYRSSLLDPDMKYTIALIPFLNESSRKNAGEMMTLHFVRWLIQLDNFIVIEPGIVREVLLKSRIIMDDGISLAQMDLISHHLDVDLILTGKVIDYQDYTGSWGKPKVDFSTLVIERKSRKVVWASKSYNEGDDGVFFFNRGKINTAYAMASEMVLSVLNIMLQ